MNAFALRLLPAFVWIAVVSGCAGLSEISIAPRVSLADLRLTEIGMMEQRYAAALRVQNPNDVPLRVSGMEYTIYINGRRFADGVRGRGFHVPAYAEKLIDVTMTSSVLRVMEQLKGLGETDQAVFRYRIAGSMNIAGMRRRLRFSHEDVIDLSPTGGS